jgi:alpha-ketoglutarate-dependent taurine dioxygenase
MEKFKFLRKNGILFNVGNKGTIQVAGSKKGKFIKTLSDVSDFSLSGGHKDNHYLSTHGHAVHRLVAEAWIGPIPEGYTVNHKDMNKFNNSVENLEIVTVSENLKHAWENGAFDSIKVPGHELHRREIFSDFYKWNSRWGVYNLNFKVISVHPTQEEAARSIGVSRQAANQSFRKGIPTLKNFYICRINQVNELKERALWQENN